MLNIVDKIIIVYETLLSIHVLLFRANIAESFNHIVINMLIIVWVLFIAKLSVQYQRQPFLFLHTFYPLFLLMWHYPQACDLRYSVISMSLDSLLIKWDLAIFKIPLYEVIPKKLNVFMLEIAHWIYFSYYLSLAIPAWCVYHQRHRRISEYLFVIVAANVIHQWLVILLPADGPVPLRAEIIPEGLLAIPIMDLIYKLHPGGGALPSLHVAGAMITTWYAHVFLPKHGQLWFLYFLAITISTFACCYHYPIDSLAGIITGWLCLKFLPLIYAKIK